MSGYERTTECNVTDVRYAMFEQGRRNPGGGGQEGRLPPQLF